MGSEHTKVVTIIQARMGSSRLPGKVLMDLGGDTVLAHVLRRVRRATLVQETIVATTESSADDAVVRECQRLGILYFRGSEQDVLDRYYRAALESAAEAVVRITSDCPLIDPELVDATIQAFLDQQADYASNSLELTYPRGLDVEIFTAAALQQAWKEARAPHEREHVTPYFYEHPELFRLISVKAEKDYSRYRWTLDTPADLETLRAIYCRLDGAEDFRWRKILSFVEAEPELAEINSHVLQKPLH